MSALHLLPCLDSPQMAAARRRELRLPVEVAAALGQSAVDAARDGSYVTQDGQTVVWRDAVQAACAATRSIAPDAPLPQHKGMAFPVTRVQVTNETTLGAARRLVEGGWRPLALNCANGFEPGGGFLHGATAQEEALCRASALYATLVDDPMYAAHRTRRLLEATDWAIYAPDVPVFRQDDGTVLAQPWLLSVLTCAAPYAPIVGQPRAGDLLQHRIQRVLAIARAYGHAALVLGAWGCGAFANDPHRTARDFRQALATTYRGAFAEIVFAIADWSPARTFLGPFREVFAAQDEGEGAPQGDADRRP